MTQVGVFTKKKSVFSVFVNGPVTSIFLDLSPFSFSEKYRILLIDSATMNQPVNIKIIAVTKLHLQCI